MNKKKCVFFFKVAQVAYGYGCTATTDCVSGLSLICTTTGYLCNCPTSLSAYKCDCSSTQYYKDSISGCGNVFLLLILLFGFLSLKF